MRQSHARAIHKLLVILILLAAFAFRVAAISRTPAGLSHDEAYNGIAALDVLHGQFRIFYEINKGIEPLIIWLEGLAFYLFGIGPVQLRLVNIFAGMLTVALVYPFTARLLNRRVALLAMAALAVLFWAVFVSRLALRAALLPPLLLLALYLFWRGLTGRRVLLFLALSGAVTGLIMYTYLSSRFVPFIMVAMVGYRLATRQLNRRHWLGLALFVAIWAALVWPLGCYFVANAASFSRRADQVSNLPAALNGDFGPLLRHTLRTAGMFTVAGDTTDRYNLNGRPVFDWANGLLFYLGLGLLAWRLAKTPGRAGPAALLLSAAFLMLLPGFITDDSPHFLRTIGVLPLAAIFWAVGVEAVARRAGQIWPRRFWPALLPGLLLAFTAAHTGYDYFWRWHASADARRIYGADITAVARYLQASPGGGLPVISAEYYRDLDRFRFDLYFGHQPPFALWFDGRQSLAFPPPGSDLSPRYLFPASALPPQNFAALLREVPQESGPEYKLYRLPADGAAAAINFKPVNQTFNNDLVLTGYQILEETHTGGQFHVALGWQALRALPPGTDYTFLAQLRDNRGQVWLQTDGNGYDPADWQPGIMGLQLLTFRLPGDVPPLAYQLWAQVVNRRTGQPLGTAGGQTAILLGPLRLKLADTPRPVEAKLVPNFTELPASAGETGLALRGYQLAPTSLAPGATAELTLHWQVMQPPPQNYRWQLFLQDDAGAEAYRWPPVSPLGGEWPTRDWPTGYWVQDRLTLAIGPDVPAGKFLLRGRWVAAGNIAPVFELGTAQIRPAQ